MPLIQVDAPEGDLDKTKQDALMSQLSNAVLKAEGAPLESAGAQSLVPTTAGSTTGPCFMR